MNIFKTPEFKGTVFSIAVGMLFFVLAPWLNTLNAVILGLLGGILIGNLTTLHPSYDAGIKFTGSKFLELSILFLAFDIDLSGIQKLGVTSFAIVVVVVVFVLIITLLLAKKMNCPGTSGYLVGFGTAICGSSAIAALSSGITNNKKDVGISLAAVNLLGTLGMLVLPLLFCSLSYTHNQIGVIIGASLHSVGNVAGAGYGMTEAIGKTAITIKLARVALLPVAVILFTLIIKRNENLSWKKYLKLPYYLWGFIIISVFVSLFTLPEFLINGMEQGGKIILTIAMTAIGFKVSFRELFHSGQKALLFGLVVFGLQLALLFGLVSFMEK
jgi:uncharacterized integral membrane protein (TIGR00698 family)